MKNILNKCIIFLLDKYNNNLQVNNLKELSRNRFIRNVATVASGTIAAQTITILFSPIITRLYGPEAFGVLGVFTSMVTIFGPIAALTYPAAIVLPKKDSDAKGLIQISLYIAATMALILTLLIILFSEKIGELLQVQVLNSYLLLLPIIMFFTAGTQVAEQWLIRKKQFSVKAKVAATQAFLVNGTKSGVGLLYPMASSLIFIASLGHLLHALMLAWGARIASMSETVQTSNKLYDLKILKILAMKHYDFPVYRAPHEFLNGISESMPILMLTAFYGPAAAGFYTIGDKVMRLPSKLIGRAVGDVFYPRIAEAAHSHESISKLLIKATLYLTIIGIVPFGIVFIFGPFLFGVFFGSEWIVAGEYARWLALWSYLVFINNPSVKTLPVISAQRFKLIFTTFSISVRLCVLALGGYFFESATMAIALYSISSAIIYFILILLTIKKSKDYDEKIVS